MPPAQTALAPSAVPAGLSLAAALAADAATVVDLALLERLHVDLVQH